jgi:hypothetical protein
MPTREPSSFFYEEQPLRVRRLRWRLAILPLMLTTLAVAQVGFGRRLGNHPVTDADLVTLTILLWIVYGWLVRVRLVTEVHAGELAVGLRGMLRRERFASTRWASWEQTTFDPSRDFGGYGVRRIGSTRAYIAGGTQGVRIALRDGGAIVIGSECPSDLVAALDRARRGSPG